MRVIPEFLLDDKPHGVMLDTGSEMYLVGTRAALDEVTLLRRRKADAIDLGGHRTSVNEVSAKVDLTIGRQPFAISFFVYPDSQVPHGLLLGAGALRDMDFLLDFRHQRLCFPMHPNLH